MAVPVFMTITGYVSSLSFSRRGLNLKTAYLPREILAKWTRFIIPYIPAYILSIASITIGKNEYPSSLSAVKMFISGGRGPGSYYFPVMIQAVIMMPLICYVVRKFRFKGLAFFFALNVLYEIVKTAINMSPAIYRLCMLRYIFIISYGSYLFFEREHAENNRWSYAAGIAGVIYLIIFRYMQIKPIITEQWTGTSVFAVLLIVPVMMKLMKLTNVHSEFLETLGKASFDIFLVQMIYFLAAPKLIYVMLG